MQIGEYVLVNTEKFERALNGLQRSDGSFIGGVGKGAYYQGGAWFRDDEKLSEKEVDSLVADLLAEYDKVGGLITRDGDPIKTGSFYNFKARKPHENPKIERVFRINGKTIAVADGEEEPGLVKAKKQLDAEESDTKKAKKAKKGKKSDEGDSDEHSTD